MVYGGALDAERESGHAFLCGGQCKAACIPERWCRENWLIA
jgi:hypothetical protein